MDSGRRFSNFVKPKDIQHRKQTICRRLYQPSFKTFQLNVLRAACCLLTKWLWCIAKVERWWFTKRLIDWLRIYSKINYKYMLSTILQRSRFLLRLHLQADYIHLFCRIRVFMTDRLWLVIYWTLSHETFLEWPGKLSLLVNRDVIFRTESLKTVNATMIIDLLSSFSRSLRFEM